LALRDLARSRSGIESPNDVPAARSGFIRQTRAKIMRKQARTFSYTKRPCPWSDSEDIGEYSA